MRGVFGLSAFLAFVMLWAQASWASAPLHPLASFVSHMRRCGVDTFFIGEGHWDDSNFPIVTQTLRGAIEGGPTVFWREVNANGREAVFEQFFARTHHPEAIMNLARMILGRGYNGSRVERHSSWPLFASSLLNPNITSHEAFYFTSPSHRSMSRFLAQQGQRVRVASLGIAHAESNYSSNPRGLLAPRGPLTQIPNEYSHLTVAALRDMVGGFRRSCDSGHPAIIFRPTSIWQRLSPQWKPDEWAEAYLERGFVSVDWTIDAIYNFTIVAPQTLLGEMVVHLQHRPPGELRWWCDGMKGCPEEESPSRDEL